MDAEHFDTITRTLTTAGSRRRALGGLLLGSLGLLIGKGTEDAAAHDPRLTCKKLKGDRKKKCLKKAKKHNAQHAAEGSSCPPSCPVCQACDPATGQCVAANHGAVCGTQSETGGGAIRCCNGVCPDPTCRPFGNTGVECFSSYECEELNCCRGRAFVTCPPDLETCHCWGSPPGEPCGSDADCRTAGSVCVCGTCTAV